MADGLNFAPVANFTPVQAQAPANPLAVASQVMQLQQLQNQNTAFQQELAAKQAIGQIMSSAPSVEEGMQRVMRSPYAAQAAPAVASYRGAQQAEAEVGNINQRTSAGLMEQHQKGIGFAMNGLLPALADPQKLLDSQAQSVLKTFPPDMQKVLNERIKDLKTGIEVGVTKDMTPEQALAKRQANMAGALSPHVPADQLYGPTVNQDVGNATEVYRLPPAWDNQNKPRQLLYSIPKGTAPAVGGGGVLTPGVPAERAQLPAGPSAAPAGGLGPRSAAGQEANPLGIPTVASPSAPAPAPGPKYSMLPAGGPSADMIKQSYPGKVLNVQTGEMLPSPGTPAESAHEAELNSRYNKEDQQKYTAAQNAMRVLPSLEADITSAIKNNVGPGAGAPLKVETIKLMQSALDLINPDRDKSKDINTSSAESAMKSFVNMGLSAAKAQLNQPQIAAESLFKGLEGNPSYTNTPLGLKLIMSGVQSDLQRELDRRAFNVKWQEDPRNRGNLKGADEEFNRQFPIQNYAQKVLDEHRMLLDKGTLKFKDAAAVKKAFEEGLLTREQAITLGK